MTSKKITIKDNSTRILHQQIEEEAANNPAKEVIDLFVAGYDKGHKEGFESRQGEVDALKAEVSDLNWKIQYIHDSIH